MSDDTIKLEFKDRVAKFAKQQQVADLDRVTISCDIEHKFDTLFIRDKDGNDLIEFNTEALDPRNRMRNGPIPNRRNTVHTTFHFRNGDVLFIEHKNPQEMHIFAAWVLQDKARCEYLCRQLACNQPKNPTNNTNPASASTSVEHKDYAWINIEHGQRSSTESYDSDDE